MIGGLRVEVEIFGWFTISPRKKRGVDIVVRFSGREEGREKGGRRGVSYYFFVCYLLLPDTEWKVLSIDYWLNGGVLFSLSSFSSYFFLYFHIIYRNELYCHQKKILGLLYTDYKLWIWYTIYISITIHLFLHTFIPILSFSMYVYQLLFIIIWV